MHMDSEKNPKAMKESKPEPQRPVQTIDDQFDTVFMGLMQRADDTKMWTEKIIQKTEAVLEANEKVRSGREWYIDDRDTPPNVFEELSNEMVSAGVAFGADTVYGKALTKVALTQKELGNLHRVFGTNANKVFVDLLKKYLNSEMKEIAQERSNLEKARVHLDAAKSKLDCAREKGISDPEAEKSAERSLVEFDKQTEIIRLLLKKIPEAHLAHARMLIAFVEAQVDLYSESLKHLKDLQKELRALRLS